VGWKALYNDPVPQLFLEAVLVASSNGSMPPSAFESISGNLACAETVPLGLLCQKISIHLSYHAMLVL